MTGFGAARREAKGLVVDVEIRSVNHRFLQLKTRLPHELTSLEQEVDALVRSRLGRGAITVRVEVERDRGRGGALDLDLADHYARELARLQARLGLEAGPDLAVLTGLPGVLTPPAGPDPDQVRQHLKVALKEALERLDQMRITEGQALLQDLDARAARLATLVERVGKRAPQALKSASSRIKRRVKELMTGMGREGVPKEVDLAREMAVLADRSDISEELTRFRSHLEQWSRITAAGGQVGKRLDFLLQEMGREVNTMGSKAGDVQISHLVVELKAELEKQREQIQNLE